MVKRLALAIAIATVSITATATAAMAACPQGSFFCQVCPVDQYGLPIISKCFYACCVQQGE